MTDARYKDKLSLLPHHMQGAMERWIEHGIPPGDFLSALLCNDLMEAMGRADDINQQSIFNYCTYLYSYAPAGCYGSPGKFKEWMKSGGLGGMTKEQDK